MGDKNRTFDNLNLNDNLLRGIYSYGFENPSKIQMEAIPLIIEGNDIIAQAQSGTGKTGSFTRMFTKIRYNFKKDTILNYCSNSRISSSNI